MSHARGRARKVAATSAVVALVLLVLVVPALAAATPAVASGPVVAAARASRSGDVVEFEDYTLPAGQTARSVVIIHGNATIAGTVERNVVVVGGDATLTPTAVVGATLSSQDSSVVVVGGSLTTRPGATVHGKTVQVAGFHLRGVIDALATGTVLRRPVGLFWGRWQLLFLPIVALVVAGLFPRGVARVADRVRARFWPSFGWGLLWFAIVLVLLVLLSITVIGLIVSIPGAFALPAVLLFCLVGVAALVGRLVLSSSERYRDNVLAAALVGAVIASLVASVPVLGWLVLFVATMAGFGAGLSLFNEWRRTRRAATVPQTPGPAPSGPAPSGPADWTPPGYLPTESPAPSWTPPPAATPPQGWSAPQGWAPPAEATPPPQGTVAPAEATAPLHDAAAPAETAAPAQDQTQSEPTGAVDDEPEPPTPPASPGP